MSNHVYTYRKDINTLTQLAFFHGNMLYFSTLEIHLPIHRRRRPRCAFLGEPAECGGLSDALAFDRAPRNAH